MDASRKTPLNYYQRLKQRLELTGDSEPEQAIKVRLTIGVAVLLYFCFPWGESESFSQAFFSLPSVLAIAYYLVALAIALSIVIRPVPSPARRLVGAILDLVPLSVLMFLAGNETVFFFVAYLWVILGNGFRYGVNYLYFSLAISLIGFTFSITYGDYWNDPQHQPFGLSLLLVLILVPLYAAFLINKLHSAIASAKQANQAKSRFLANMSHELRTPLNGVIGIADLIGETSLNLQQREFVKIMRSSANTLLGLIENVLDISKIEAGKITIASELFDLHQLINNVMLIQKPMGAAKGLLVSMHIDPKIDYSLKGDPQHLKQVLINLVGNAIKFTDSGAVKLIINHIESTDNQCWVRFEVTDTGPGIMPEFLDTIFDDFKQAPEVRQSKISGTGLGTTISKELVELMGGQIGVNSEPGKGTMFWVEMPFKATGETHLNLAENKILLLSNEETKLQLEPSLRAWSIQHHWVDNSVKAFSELMKHAEVDKSFDTLLIDQSCMHNISPVQYAHMLKSEKVLAHLSLILINTNNERISIPELTDHYISVLSNTEDKRLLFNALHAANSVPVTDDNVVSLASHYTAQQDQPLSILIAEDNHVNQQVLKGLLEHAGVQTRIAASGEEALDIITDAISELDMLILDMNMPIYTGPEVAKAVRMMETERHIPIIILTADATPEARQECIDS
ncbi:ATP-binding protein, partial [Methylophaga sp.]|uniref:ATP-binding protein n=1 Tax=Methylophaga sp. TaxID=2024840 RepID=UPI003F69F44E